MSRYIKNNEHNESSDQVYLEDDNEYRANKKKQSHRRQQVRSFKNTWKSKNGGYDDVSRDDLYKK